MLIWAGIFTLGLIIGGLVVWLFIKRQDCVGTLFFYKGEPGELPIMCSELNEPPESIGKRRYVIFKVSRK